MSKKFDWSRERRKLLDDNPDLDQLDKDISELENLGLNRALAKVRAPDNWIRYSDVERVMRHMNFPIVGKDVFLGIVRSQSRFGKFKEERE